MSDLVQQKSDSILLDLSRDLRGLEVQDLPPVDKFGPYPLALLFNEVQGACGAEAIFFPNEPPPEPFWMLVIALKEQISCALVVLLEGGKSRNSQRKEMFRLLTRLQKLCLPSIYHGSFHAPASLEVLSRWIKNLPPELNRDWVKEMVGLTLTSNLLHGLTRSLPINVLVVEEGPADQDIDNPAPILQYRQGNHPYLVLGINQSSRQIEDVHLVVPPHLMEVK